MCSASLLLSTPVETVKGRRPHTKLQQRCIDLADTLPPLTEEQRLWARSKMAALGYYVVKKQPQYPKTREECCEMKEKIIFEFGVMSTLRSGTTDGGIT